MSVPSMADLRELRDEFRTDAVRRAVEMAQRCDAAARELLDRAAADDDPLALHPADTALVASASAQAWAAVARLLAPNGAKD